MEMDEERKSRLEKMVATQVGPGDRGRKKSKKGMDWIWIGFGFNLD